MKETRKTSSGLTGIVYRPLASVATPWVVPWIITVAPGIGFPLSSVTLPLSLINSTIFSLEWRSSFVKWRILIPAWEESRLKVVLPPCF